MSRSSRIIYVGLLLSLMSMPAMANEPVTIDRGAAPHHPRQPQIAVDAKGTVHVVYGVGNRVRYRRSFNGGKEFAQPVDLPVTQVISLGMRRGPRIAVSKNSVCVTVIGGPQGKGRDGDVLAFQSTDGGENWNNPVKVNDVDASAREGLHAMAADAKGNLYCAWLDLRRDRSEVMAAASTDGGRTWTKNVLVYRSPDGSVCECCHPSIATDDEGRVHVFWRNSLAGARDMYFATSVDGGKSFGAAVKMGSGSWPLEACPMDGGAIAARGDRIVSVWRRERSIFFVDGKRDEKQLGIGEQPWIALAEKGPFIIWLKKRGDAAYLLTPGSDSPIQLSPHAADPVIATGPNGRGPVVAAWESRDGNRETIQCQVVQE
ncbi:MAG: sialidase family protein [Planctomycetaceae bacterium]